MVKEADKWKRGIEDDIVQPGAGRGDMRLYHPTLSPPSLHERLDTRLEQMVSLSVRHTQPPTSSMPFNFHSCISCSLFT